MSSDRFITRPVSMANLVMTNNNSNKFDENRSKSTNNLASTQGSINSEAKLVVPDGPELNSVGTLPRRWHSLEKPLLVFVNPFGGNKTAGRTFYTLVAPLLLRAGIAYEVMETQYQNHARVCVQEIDLNQYGGIMTVSGDGLVFEVINGLMTREDYAKAIETLPLSVIPGGSGNAFAAALLFYNKVNWTDENFAAQCCQLAIRREVCNLDLMLVETNFNKQYAFLSICWGIVSDIDIKSERFRYLGPQRFAIEALIRIIDRKVYHGKLSFLPAYPEQYRDQLPRRSVDGISGDGNSTSFYTGNDELRTSSPIPEETDGQLASTVGDDESEVEVVAELQKQLDDLLEQSNISSIEMEASISEADSPKAERSESVASSKSISAAFEADDSIINCPAHPVVVKDYKLPPLDEPVPNGWVTIEDDFLSIVACNVSHINNDFIVSPTLKIDDGLMCVLILKATCKRMDLIKMFTDSNNVDKVNSWPTSLIEKHYVRAFRLEPTGTDGILTLDGEHIEYGAIQAQTIRGLGSVFA